MHRLFADDGVKCSCVMSVGLIAAFPNFPIVLLQPVLCYGRRTISPHIDHQVRGQVGNSVRPSPGQVQYFARRHNKTHRSRSPVEGVFCEVWIYIKTVEHCAPFQGPLCLGVVQEPVVLRREDGPSFLAYYLIDEVVFAVYVALCECSWCANPKWEENGICIEVLVGQLTSQPT